METREQPCFAKVESLVINWHVVEACNYACKYCYAKWDTPENTRDVIRDEGKTRGLLEALATFFAPTRSGNPLAAALRWQRTRLNIAGGEPLLQGDAVVRAAEHARALGMEVSIITNGSRLTPHLMARLAPNLSLLGVSVDSWAPESNRAIGRTDRRGRHMDLSQLSEVVDLGRRMNPSMHVKLNTVVNRVNHHEDMMPLVQALRPDRWKVLRVLPVQGA